MNKTLINWSFEKLILDESNPKQCEFRDALHQHLIDIDAVQLFLFVRNFCFHPQL